MVQVGSTRQDNVAICPYRGEQADRERRLVISTKSGRFYAEQKTGVGGG